jgi:hypothetical protein
MYFPLKGSVWAEKTVEYVIWNLYAVLSFYTAHLLVGFIRTHIEVTDSSTRKSV